jgi:N-acetylglucosaminyldiphosphoundecaprenol N-acetyl-beta-D-mannosaminyltransferase
MDSAVATIAGLANSGGSHYVCVTSVHGIVESQSDPALKRIHNDASLVTPDGMPLVWTMKLLGNRDVSRVYGPDLFLNVMRISDRAGLRHFFYGATDETLQKLRANVEKRFPDVQIVGTYAPPFRPLTEDEDAEVIRLIDASGANVVWVGLSTPKQERWMAGHIERIKASVAIGVGAAFDFHAGVTPQAPSFIRHSGLEWLYRLLTEPRRLWRRYAKIVPYFLVYSVCQRLGLKSYANDLG